MCAPSHSYPERNTHAPYSFVICDLSGSIIFFHIILKTERFSKKKIIVTVHKIVFEFPLRFYFF